MSSATPDAHQGTALPVGRTLLPPLSAEARHLLDGYLLHLGAVLPLTPRHRRDLPKAVAELSQLLTSERGERRPDYLQTPRFHAAYCWHFLPWNLFRLGRLLTGLGREWDDLTDGDLLLDVGAGPLALTQALWMVRPDLRDKKLRWICLDRARKVMQAGRDLFDRLTGGNSPWEIHLVGDSLQRGLPHINQHHGPFRLVAAANVVNEAVGSSHGEETLAERVARLLDPLTRRLDESRGRLLLVEPGTRLGGTLMGLARESLLDDGFSVLAPCTHHAECPLLGRNAPGWCHQLMDVEGAPEWLQELAVLAALPKRQASLSLLLAGRQPPAQKSSQKMARVVSSSFPLPSQNALGRYACSAEGLLLLVEQAKAPLRAGGEALEYVLEAPPRRDAKSGALLARSPHSPAPAPYRDDRPAPRPRPVSNRPRPAGGPPKGRGRRR
ncbi:MAG: small ribosomal subunit Rsm22 family protein [Desulfovibrio sp.]|nr:small ribosomal subunit Rsm22 family protein [Desulfovibrio sp.]MCA1985032.1 small ribosomal subunit Rsm22 family protein [Desulfovibrio sp.]